MNCGLSVTMYTNSCLSLTSSTFCSRCPNILPKVYFAFAPLNKEAEEEHIVNNSVLDPYKGHFNDTETQHY